MLQEAVLVINLTVCGLPQHWSSSEPSKTLSGASLSEQKKPSQDQRHLNDLQCRNEALLPLNVTLYGGLGIAYDRGVLENQLPFMCRQIVMTPDGRVEMGLNIAPRNHREAALSIGLALFVILELTVFIGVLNNTAMDLLVKPVAAILHVIRTQAGKVMAALDKDDVSHCSPLFCKHPGLLTYQGPSCTGVRCRPYITVMRGMGTASHI